MIHVDHLTKKYGRFRAVDDLSFDVAQGEIVGFLGPNGAGKTTTMRILAGYLPATGGSASICGMDIFKESLEVRRRIGYLPEMVPLYGEMRVIEYLRYRGQLKGLRGAALRERVATVSEACAVADVARKLIGSLSKGYRQRVGLADALINDPEVLILDEPTIGLDPNQIRLIRELVVSLRGQHAVLLSSHILSEIQSVCDRVLIINEGRIVASDTPENLVGLLHGSRRVVAEIRGPEDAILTDLKALDGIARVSVTQDNGWNRFVCECADGRDVRGEIFRLAGGASWEMRELRSEHGDLEDVFVQITGGGKTLANDGDATS